LLNFVLLILNKLIFAFCDSADATLDHRDGRNSFSIEILTFLNENLLLNYGGRVKFSSDALEIRLYLLLLLLLYIFKQLVKLLKHRHFGLLLLEHGVIGVLSSLFLQLLLLLLLKVFFYDVLNRRGELFCLAIDPDIEDRVVMHLRGLHWVSLLHDGAHVLFEGLDGPLLEDGNLSALFDF
jgi:hypothetical protein